MSPEQQLQKYVRDIGARVERSGSIIEVHEVDCVNNAGKITKCILRCEYDQNSEKATGMGETLHAVEVEMPDGGDGKVYEANGVAMQNVCWEDGRTKSHLSIKKGKQGENIEESVWERLRRITKRVKGAAQQKRIDGKIWHTEQSVFKIPNSYETRANLYGVHKELKEKKIMVVGLGGTGSYILDLIWKTPVAEIHLVDPDGMEWHNVFRAPGTIDEGEKAKIGAQQVGKAEYYANRYGKLRHGIYAHNKRMSVELAQTLKQQGVSFGFVCIDQNNGQRQDEVYKALEEAGIDFVDSGINVQVNDNKISASVKTFAQQGTTGGWVSAIPDAEIQGGENFYGNTQICEVNALAACLAVMEWRRQSKQYVGEEAEERRVKFKTEPTKVIVR